ncbi:MAG: methionyl-tRNA formyltransferase, partial [Bacteroidota bacterium]
QKQLAIGIDETAGELHDRMMLTGAELVVQTLRQIASGNAEAIEQESLIQSRPVLHHAPKIFSADCRIDWNKTCQEIHNQIRGLSPFPGAFTFMKKNDGSLTTMKIFKAKPLPGEASNDYGNIHLEANRLLVACADGMVEVLELQMEGKKRMPTIDFLRGTKLIDSTFE